jgi:hypothetical protein
MNKKTRTQIIKSLLLVVVLVSAAGIGTALVQENKEMDFSGAPDIEFEWEAPTTGTPVHHYVAQVLVNTLDTLYYDAIPTESLLVAVAYGNRYEVRVAGVDIEGIQGPWSAWSPPFNPEIQPPGF